MLGKYSIKILYGSVLFIRPPADFSTRRAAKQLVSCQMWNGFKTIWKLFCILDIKNLTFFLEIASLI